MNNDPADAAELVQDRFTAAHESIEQAKDGGALTWAAIDAALAAGEIDEPEWFRRYQAALVPTYLAGDNPRAQSGHSGDPARWEQARRPLLTAIDRPGTLLDVGCANGHLMECLHAWAAEDGMTVEPYGLELSPDLADLARMRLTHWADRIWTGNALTFAPPRRFDYLRTSLGYVPFGRRKDLVARLLTYTDRLIIGIENEDAHIRESEQELVAMGYAIAGRVETPHSDPRLKRRACWIDRPGRASP
jgi:hypothetical protein